MKQIELIVKKVFVVIALDPKKQIYIVYITNFATFDSDVDLF